MVRAMVEASQDQEHGPGLSVKNVSKTFGGTRALSGVSLDLAAGEIHALVGQNGSGKSTLFKILAGYHEPDGGATLEVGGKLIPLPLHPGAVNGLGFRFVHQDLGIAGSLSILENVRVGHFATGYAGRIRWSQERALVAKLLRDFGVDMSPDTPCERLSQAEKAIVAIIRGLQSRPGERPTLLVLDEPTAYLPPPEIRRLFVAVRRLRETGVAIVFSTHRLDEVKELSDRVSVLRDGHLVGTYKTEETTESALIRAIIGKDLDSVYPNNARAARDKPVLEVRGLCGGPVADVSFTLHEGEVLGVTGLVGMGHDEIAYLAFGGQASSSGTIRIDGTVCRSLNPRTAIELGVGLVPANRQRDSGIQSATLKENVTIPVLGGYFRCGTLDHAGERRDVTALLDAVDVRPRGSQDRALATLSGGNQQKALLAKWLNVPGLRILILHEPTQGVDLGARKAIFELLRNAVDSGMAILLASAEYEDLAHLCDRVVVMRHGRPAAELSGADLTEERIVEHCYRSDVPQ
ncbi:sugar ABC transporter ATP-binding protein [Dactylosporangium maewongense]|uniref:Sugar ABC transporter ATP-binding protein n=2 Tax=Dactylosporangium maewongense TaxID=634393 RepID=A0ABN2CXU5_9ACTN